MPLNSFQTGQILIPVPPPLLAQLTAIYQFRGKQELYERQAPEVLASLQASATIESTESSNRIEGVVASPARVREIVGLGAKPVTRSEAEIAGYRDVLATIHASYPHIIVSPNIILQMHRDLYRLAGVPGGEWKNVDNTIEATLPDGSREVLFRPVAAFLTAPAMSDLCRDYQMARTARSNDEIILIAALVLDFLCIHPFLDGNGRIARLLTSLTLYQAGLTISRYVSVERIIEQTRDSYYATLRASSEGWHSGDHSIQPWLDYFLGVILAAYRELDERLETTSIPRKSARVGLAIEQLPEQFTFSEVERACPGVSRATIKLAMRKLREEGDIEVARGGRHALWKKRRGI